MYWNSAPPVSVERNPRPVAGPNEQVELLPGSETRSVSRQSAIRGFGTPDIGSTTIIVHGRLLTALNSKAVVGKGGTNQNRNLAGLSDAARQSCLTTNAGVLHAGPAIASARALWTCAERGEPSSSSRRAGGTGCIRSRRTNSLVRVFDHCETLPPSRPMNSCARRGSSRGVFCLCGLLVLSCMAIAALYSPIITPQRPRTPAILRDHGVLSFAPLRPTALASGGIAPDDREWTCNLGVLQGCHATTLRIPTRKTAHQISCV